MSDSALHIVTGGSGYFGNLLVKSLLKRGYRVRIFDLLDSTDRAGEVEFVQGDIRDLAAVEVALTGATVVHHNVAMVPLAKDKAAFWSVNRDGTANVLAAGRSCNVAKIIYTSSSAVYGVPTQLPVLEDHTPAPAEAYGEAKLAGEKLCHEASAQGLDVSIIRPRTIMGHGRLGIMQMLFEWIRIGRNVPVLDGGNNVYQFVHAEDLSEACILASERPGSRTYNIGADDYGSMRAALEALTEHAGTGSKVRSVPSALAVTGMKITSALGLSPLGDYHALMYGREMYFDCNRAHKELGWSARHSNQDMFIQSYEWYLENREEVMQSGERSHHRAGVKQGALALFSRLL